MRNVAQAVLILLAMGVGCSNPATKPRAGTESSPPATAPPATKPTRAVGESADTYRELAGRWTGSASIVNQAVQQRQLAVDLAITPDGSVTGTVGDSTLAGATIAPGRSDTERALKMGRDYRVHGSLQGDMVRAEHLRRDTVDIVFDRAADGTLVGGLHSSGAKVGDKDSMMVSAAKMVLHRQPAETP
jgi:hypothetical protein